MPSGQTAFALIKGSLGLIGAISVGEVPTADEANDALDRLNDLFETWSTESLSVVQTDNQVFSLVGGQAIYQIGPSAADFVTPRPVSISGGYTTVNYCDFPFTMIGPDDYNDISVKASGSDIIQVVCYLNAMPNAILKVWPVPASGVTMTLNTSTILTQVPNLQTALVLPPAAYMAAMYTLALLLAPFYGATPSPLVTAAAIKAMADYKRTNRIRRTLKFDMALTDGPLGYDGLTSYVSNGGNTGVPGPVTNVVLTP